MIISIFISIISFILSKNIEYNDLLNTLSCLESLRIEDNVSENSIENNSKFISMIEKCLIKFDREEREKILNGYSIEEEVDIATQQIKILSKGLNISSSERDELSNLFIKDNKIDFNAAKNFFKTLLEKKRGNDVRTEEPTNQNEDEYSILSNIEKYYSQFKNSIGTTVLLFAAYFYGLMILNKINTFFDLKTIFIKGKSIKRIKNKKKKVKVKEKICK